MRGGIPLQSGVAERARNRIRGGVALVALVLLASVPGARALEWELVARRGQAAPGGGMLDFVGAPAVLGDGSVVLYGYGAAYEPNEIYRWDSELGLRSHYPLTISDLPASSPILRVDRAPRSGSSLFNASKTGAWMTVARRGVLLPCADPFPNRGVSVVVDDTGASTLVGPPGEPVPGAGVSWVFASDFESRTGVPVVNANGEVAFAAPIRFGDLCAEDPLTPFADAVLGPDGAGGVTLIAQTRDPAPDGPTGAVMLVGGAKQQMQIDDTGEVVFAADVRIGPSGPDLYTVYRWNAEQGLRRVVREGDPDLLGGTFGYGYLWPLLGRGGHVAVVNDFWEPTVIYVQDRDDDLEVRHVAGDPAPGLAGASFESFVGVSETFADPFTSSPPYAIDANGALAFVARASVEAGSTLLGVWAPDASGALGLRVLAGELVPDAAGFEATFLQVLAMNDARDVLILATLREIGVPPEQAAMSFVYLLSRADGTIEAVLRQGQEMEFEPGSVRSASFSELAFDAQLTTLAAEAVVLDPPVVTAVFSATLPEPGAAGTALALLALGLLSWRRRASVATAFVGALVACGVSTPAQALDWGIVAEVDTDDYEQITDFAWMPDGALRFFIDRPLGNPLFDFYEWREATGIEVLDVLDPTGSTVSGLTLRDHVSPFVSFEGDVAAIRRDAYLACGGGRTGHFLLSPEGSVEALLDYESPVPDLPAGWIWWNFLGPKANASGAIAFVGEAVQSESICEREPADPILRAVFAPDGAGGLTIAAMDEQQAPGNPVGAALLPLSVADMNDAGEILIWADVRLGPTGPLVPAIYRWSPAGGLQLVVQQFGATPDGASIQAMYRPLLGADGDVTLVVSTGPTSVQSHLLQADTSNTLQVIARQGDPAPGTNGRTFQSFDLPALGPDGTVTFSARIVPPTTVGLEDAGAWVRDAGGHISLLLKTGDALPAPAGSVVSGGVRVVAPMGGPGEHLLAVGIVDASQPPLLFQGTVFYARHSDGQLEQVFANPQSVSSRPYAFHPFAIAYDEASSRLAVRALSDYAIGTQALLVATLPEPGEIGAALALLTLALLRLRA